MYEIVNMTKEHIPLAMEIWHKQFIKHCRDGLLPDFLPGGKEVLYSYLVEQIEKGNSLVIYKDGVFAGYITWMYFDFHGEATAFCPIIGHAALSYDEANLYRELYIAASRKWVLDNRFNHLWMTFFNDRLLKELLYDFGFGSYVIDACKRVESSYPKVKCKFRVTMASVDDVEKLLHFANETEDYYRDSPIFLKRDLFTKEEILHIIQKQHALLAWDGESIIGVMSYSTQEDFHFERLTSLQSAYVTGIGGYILSEYRGNGIGSHLVREMFNHCYEEGKTHVHVSFESANPYAIQFWPKYFNPVIRSVRRTINKDANS